MNFLVDGKSSSCSRLKAGSIIDKSIKRNGLASLRHEFTESQQDTGCEAVSAPKGAGLFDGSSIYWHAWIKLSDDFDWGDYQQKAKFAHLKRANETNPVYGVIYIRANGFEFTGGMIKKDIRLSIDLDPKDGSCSTAKMNGPFKECTEWREYVVHMKQNTCPSCNDGIFEVYIDGELADTVTNTTFAEEMPNDGVAKYNFAWAGLGGKAYPQMCANGDSCPGIGGYMWVDDISIRIGEDLSFSNAKPMSPAPLKPK